MGKRSGALEHLAQEMADTQGELEAKAAQLREVAARMRRGLRLKIRSGELQQIAKEMTQVLEDKVENIREKVRRGLLRAHRTGELHELLGELDELADVVPTLETATPLLPEPGPAPSRQGRQDTQARLPAERRRWAEMTSSDSDPDTRQALVQAH